MFCAYDVAVTSGGRRLRADATRNRAAIARATKSLIIARGPGVEMDEIAREAGLAVGTLYRHFPTKDDLVASVLTSLGAEIEALHAEAVARVEAGRSSGFGEIALLFRQAVVDFAENRLLNEVTQDGGRCLPPEIHVKATAAMRKLVAAAHEAGELSFDVTVDDVTLLLTTSPGAAVPRDARERWVTLVLRSLAAAPT